MAPNIAPNMPYTSECDRPGYRSYVASKTRLANYRTKNKLYTGRSIKEAKLKVRCLLFNDNSGHFYDMHMSNNSNIVVIASQRICLMVSYSIHYCTQSSCTSDGALILCTL